MKIRTSLSVLATSLGFAFAVLPGQASAATAPNYEVTQAQVDSLQAGETSSDVIQALGKPETKQTKWLDGTSSLMYDTSDALGEREHVYVDLDTSGKMTDVAEFRAYDEN